MISNNSDLYQLIHLLADKLHQGGEDEWCNSLRDSLSISTVPGEILGELRNQLQQLYPDDIAVKLGLQKQIGEALRYLDIILGAEK